MAFIELPELNGRILPAFPCHVDTKKPFTEHGFKDATTDKTQFNRLTRNQEFLYGIPTGAATGFDVLDIDPAAFGWEKKQTLPTTRIHKTPRGGTHYFFNNHPSLRNSTSKIAPGVDVRADGGYIIWWPKQKLPFAENPIIDWPNNILQLDLSTVKTPSPTSMGSPDQTLGEYGIWIPFKKCKELLAPDLHDKAVITEIELSLTAGERSGLPIAAAGFSVGKFSRQSLYAIQAAVQSLNEISQAPRGKRNTLLNARSYSLGRIMARNWTPASGLIRALWRGAVACGLVKDDGPFQVINTIVSGLKAGLDNPYPDLEDKP